MRIQLIQNQVDNTYRCAVNMNNPYNSIISGWLQPAGGLRWSGTVPGPCAPSRPCWSGTSGKTFREIPDNETKQKCHTDKKNPDKLSHSPAYISESRTTPLLRHFGFLQHRINSKCHNFRRACRMKQHQRLLFYQIKCECQSARVSQWLSQPDRYRWTLDKSTRSRAYRPIKCSASNSDEAT